MLINSSEKYCTLNLFKYFRSKQICLFFKFFVSAWTASGIFFWKNRRAFDRWYLFWHKGNAFVGRFEGENCRKWCLLHKCEKQNECFFGWFAEVKTNSEKTFKKDEKNFEKRYWQLWIDVIYYMSARNEGAKITVLENWTTNWENEIKISLITLNTKY